MYILFLIEVKQIAMGNACIPALKHGGYAGVNEASTSFEITWVLTKLLKLYFKLIYEAQLMLLLIPNCITGFDSSGGGGRRHEGSTPKGEKFHRERNDGFGGDVSARSHYQSQDSDSGGERPQRSTRMKQPHNVGDDVNSLQARENNRGGSDRHSQKPSAQQGIFIHNIFNEISHRFFLFFYTGYSLPTLKRFFCQLC